MEQALVRVPALEAAGIKTLTNGPESFTIYTGTYPPGGIHRWAHRPALRTR
jgi:hypothetical protein